MHIRIDRDVLFQAVSYTSRAIASRPTQPIYAGLLFTAEPGEGGASGTVTLSAFDNGDKVAASEVVKAEVVTAGSMLLSGKKLAELVKLLTDDVVEIVVDGNRVRMTCGTTKFALPTMPVEDYPALPVQPGRTGAVSADAFSAAIKQVIPATAADSEGMLFLSGIKVEVQGEKITLVATDRYRMAVAELNWRPDDKAFATEMVLPAKALADAAKGLAGNGAELVLGLNADGLLGLSGETRTTVMGAIDSKFVPWRQVLGTPGNITATVNAGEFARALAIASAVKAKSDPVRVTFRDEQFQVDAGNSEDGTGEELVTGSFSGSEMVIGFNPEYLRDGVLAAGTDEVKLAITSALKPVIITGKDEGDADGFRYLVMPVRLPG